MDIKSFTIEKTGRKWHQCTLNGYNAKLLINDVSSNLEINCTYTVHVNDISTHNESRGKKVVNQ